jgi:hypothetical protein
MKRTKKMPLHRDIFWVGKQWSVTGSGMQAIDQKLKGKFDIEVWRIWDDDLHDALSGEKWFNAKDFDKALAEARKHYPKPSGKAAPKARPVLAAPPTPEESMIGKEKPKANPSPSSNPSPNPSPARFTMRIIGCRAKFLPTWRVRIR